MPRTQLAVQYMNAPTVQVGTLQTQVAVQGTVYPITLPTDAEYASVDPMAPWWAMSVAVGATHPLTVCFGANVTGTTVLAAGGTRVIRVRRGQAVALLDPAAPAPETWTVEKYIPSLNWE